MGRRLHHPLRPWSMSITRPLKRTPKLSADFYRAVIARNALA